MACAPGGKIDARGGRAGTAAGTSGVAIINIHGRPPVLGRNQDQGEVMNKLGVGVIGVGEMGKRHAENVRYRVPKARLIAVADANPERARSVAAELEIEHFYDNAEDLVARTDIDAVVIGSPPRVHPVLIKSAATAKKHILCEKPLTLTLEEADEVLDVVSRAGVFFQVGHMRRYDPGYAAARQRIEAGEIGEPVLFKSIGRDAAPPPPAYFECGLNGTLFLDSSVHEFDLARWLMADEVVEVHAFAAAKSLPELAKRGAYDSGVVNLRFAGGAIGNTESFMNAGYGYDIRTEIVGTKGALQVGYLGYTPLVVLKPGVSSHDNVRHWLQRFADAYLREMADFVESVLAGRAPRVTAYDGRQAVAIALAAECSYKEDRTVRLKNPAAA